MSDEHQCGDVRRLWQSQVEESTSMSLDDLRRRVSKLNGMILARTFIAGLAFMMFIGFFGMTLTWRISPLVTQSDIEITRSIFLIAAACSFWQLVSLLRRGRRESLAEGEPQACAAFYRSELERRRGSYRRAAVWGPLAFSAVWIWGILAMPHFSVIMIVIWVLFVPFWSHFNWEAGRRTQYELDQLNGSFR